MNNLLAAAGTAAALLLATGCAQSMSAAAADSPQAIAAEAAAGAVQTSVTQAATAAKSYGQKHLGHYLELNTKRLRAEGFTPAEGVTVTVFVDHFDVCVSAASTTLPADADWATATATSADTDAVAGGVCSEADALKQFTVGG